MVQLANSNAPWCHACRIRFVPGDLQTMFGLELMDERVALGGETVTRLALTNATSGDAVLRESAAKVKATSNALIEGFGDLPVRLHSSRSRDFYTYRLQQELLDALQSFEKRVMPTLQLYHEQVKELAQARKDLARRDAEVRRLTLAYDPLQANYGRVSSENNDLARKARKYKEERDRAINMAEQAVTETGVLRSVIEPKDIKIASLEEEKKVVMGRLDDHVRKVWFPNMSHRNAYLTRRIRRQSTKARSQA